MYKKLIIPIIFAIVFALLLRIVFGIETLQDFFSVMSFTFLFLSPAIIGFITVYLLPEEKAKLLRYRIILPWFTIILFIFITIFIKIEGWACWIMISPVFFIASSIGGLIGGWLKCRKKTNTLKTSIFVLLLPLIISPIENNLGTLKNSYTANTYIDINAPKEKIWENVTRVKLINEKDDTGFLTEFLGFPRPLKAELNYNGVGAYRKAIFTKGLVFHETVTEYQDNKKMVFNIKANPYEIPSTTLDQHVSVGGKYFDVLYGVYELEELSKDKYRLHLSSNFSMNTHFNFYAGFWGKLIMKDIQNNILKIEKQRAEN